MNTRDFHVASGSLYGQRAGSLVAEKRAVAEAVVAKILFPDGANPKNPIFLSDGSSTSYVWQYYLREWIRRGADHESLRVWTNNLDVPMQLLSEPLCATTVDVRIAPGAFDFRYCANLGADAEAWASTNCGRTTCVLAVTALDNDLGPCGKGEDAKAVKKAVMQHANVLVVIADHQKLRAERDPADAASPEEWRKWRDERSKEGRLHVVTTVSPHLGTTPRAVPCTGFPDRRTPDQRESNTVARLRQALGHQFIELRV